LPPTALEAVLACVTRVDGRDLLGHDLQRRDVALSMLDLDAEPAAAAGIVDPYLRLRAWRFGFSPRRQAQDEVLRLHDLLVPRDRVAATWSARKEQVERQSAAVRATSSSWAGGLHLVELEHTRREAVLRVRQVRLLASFLLDRPLPALADPLGDGALRVAIDGDAIEVDSATAGFMWRVVRAKR
jgi:hypothetical protein